MHRYLEYTGDRTTLRLLLPKLRDIIARHMEGTRFGIGVDPADGLLRQGEKGYQLTWMDAKVGDWVVTPRRGKAVEINALWYNALRLLEGWLRDEATMPPPRPWQAAARAQESFNRRFWYAEGGYLYDVVDGETGDDTALPAQPALRHLAGASGTRTDTLGRPCWTWPPSALLTPVGLRSLAPGDPDYKPKYDGDLRARDAAYHQGTVWAWLIGPFIDAWLKVYPGDPATAARFLGGFRSASRRGLHRLDQRNLRCRRAFHSARLHRAGMERGRSAAVLGQDGRQDLAGC